ncbi:MAG TPA: hypothetical protein VGR28_04150 [Candidatus Thermoplasmatota archaeon]|jgi:hypothetical protein|nr:hypothetical protein [Candidatus Thermoplasmatota archaeon]
MRASIAITLVALAALAGCTTNVTLPEALEVNIDQGGQTANVDAQSHPQQQFLVKVSGDTTQDTSVAISIDATRTSDQRTVIQVTVKDKDSGAVLGSDTLTMDSAIAGGNVTAGNTTTNTTTGTGSSSDSTTININVRGNKNVVVVTQATEGAATVNVAAHRGQQY